MTQKNDSKKLFTKIIDKCDSKNYSQKSFTKIDT